jgi:hypothetical protein
VGPFLRPCQAFCLATVVTVVTDVDIVAVRIIVSSLVAAATAVINVVVVIISIYIVVIGGSSSITIIIIISVLSLSLCRRSSCPASSKGPHGPDGTRPHLS